MWRTFSFGKSSKNWLFSKWEACKTLQPLVGYYFFYKSKLIKTKLLKTYKLWLNIASIRLIAYFPKLGRTSVWVALKKLTKILLPKFYAFAKQPEGNNTIVKIDESKFGKRKYDKETMMKVSGFQEWSKKNQICYCSRLYQRNTCKCA